MDEKGKRILDKLQAQCVRREYCSSEIRFKAIEKLDGDLKAAEEIVKDLINNNFVNDTRYAEAFAREKAALTGWGPIKIRFALNAKRIEKAIIDAALLEIDKDKADTKALSLLENKWKTIQTDKDAKLKLLRFALSRGYSYEAIKDQVEQITNR